MGIIHALNAQTINQIAAGEVVERPASVVKELCENAIDSGATQIIVEIENGGLSMVRVSDNGCGMSFDDAKMAFERHATSKISTADDLECVQSLGFRGEALASIASVSQVDLFTAMAEQDIGTQVRIEAGQLQIHQHAPCSQGTSIAVHNLFYNTPARRKFMKNAGSEAAACHDALNRIALSHPEVSIVYQANGHQVFMTHGDDDRMGVFASLMELHNQDLKPFHIESQGITLKGVLGNADTARGNRSRQFIILCGRAVKSPGIALAVERAYSSSIPTGRFPVFCIEISLPLGDVDVNVHPAKTEVRIKYERQVISFVQDGVYNALQEVRENLSESMGFAAFKHSPTPQTTQTQQKFVTDGQIQHTYDTAWPWEVNKSIPFTTREKSSLPTELENDKGYPIPKDDQPFTENPSMHPATEIEQNSVDTHRENSKKDIEYIGQLFDTYLVFQAEQTVYIIDQHAAHERYLYEQFQKEMASPQGVAAQNLLEPIFETITPQEAQLLEEHAITLLHLGFDIQPFGSNACRVSAIPHWVSDCQTTWVKDMIASLSADSKSSPVTDRILRMACRKAVKAGQKFSTQSAKMLLNHLVEGQVPPTCPHGRPIYTTWTKYELEKQFKRVL